ncbi:MAG: diguanylate phosphodiesterase, partial [Brevundimonas sp.]|nr:diguanylate phosphodiesterase [Brevundimonas sp.]
MRALTQGFLLFGYLFLSMTVGAFVWRAGLGAGAGAAAGIASLGLLAAIHTWISGKAERAALKKEIDQVRDAHRLLADAMESTQGALTELAQAIESGALSSTEQLSGEVRMLESLIQQMSESIDQRISQPTPDNSYEARHREQSNVL